MLGVAALVGLLLMAIGFYFPWLLLGLIIIGLLLEFVLPLVVPPK